VFVLDRFLVLKQQDTYQDASNLEWLDNKTSSRWQLKSLSLGLCNFANKWTNKLQL